jgi:hypothetical protein
VLNCAPRNLSSIQSEAARAYRGALGGKHYEPPSPLLRQPAPASVETLWEYMRTSVPELKDYPSLEALGHAMGHRKLSDLFPSTTMPRVRNIAFNLHFKPKTPGQKLEPKWVENIIALAVYLTGREAAEPCHRCLRLAGPFQGCVMPSEEAIRHGTLTMSACANCIYGWQSKACSHHPNFGKPKTKREFGDVKSEDSGDVEVVDSRATKRRKSSRSKRTSRIIKVEDEDSDPDGGIYGLPGLQGLALLLSDRADYVDGPAANLNEDLNDCVIVRDSMMTTMDNQPRPAGPERQSAANPHRGDGDVEWVQAGKQSKPAAQRRISARTQHANAIATPPFEGDHVAAIAETAPAHPLQSTRSVPLSADLQLEKWETGPGKLQIRSKLSILHAAGCQSDNVSSEFRHARRHRLLKYVSKQRESARKRPPRHQSELCRSRAGHDSSLDLQGGSRTPMYHLQRPAACES